MRAAQPCSPRQVSQQASRLYAALLDALEALPVAPPQAERRELAGRLVHLADRLWPATQTSHPPGRHAAAPWSIDPTGGKPENWPAAWSRLLPDWVRRASSFGVTHQQAWARDTFTGTAAALIALGILGAADLPGAPGRGKSMSTFRTSGAAKSQGDSASCREAAMQVVRRGAQFRVTVFAPAESGRHSQYQPVDPPPLSASPPVARVGIGRPALVLVRSTGGAA